MADLANDHKLSPSNLDDGLGQGNGNDAHRPAKRRAVNNDDDDDDDDGKPGRERRKIDIKFIQDKSRRHITFSKRKAGIMKKVSRLHRHREEARKMRVDCDAINIATPPIRAGTSNLVREWSMLTSSH